MRLARSLVHSGDDGEGIAGFLETEAQTTAIPAGHMETHAAAIVARKGFLPDPEAESFVPASSHNAKEVFNAAYTHLTRVWSAEDKRDAAVAAAASAPGPREMVVDPDSVDFVAASSIQDDYAQNRAARRAEAMRQLAEEQAAEQQRQVLIRNQEDMARELEKAAHLERQRLLNLRKPKEQSYKVKRAHAMRMALHNSTSSQTTHAYVKGLSQALSSLDIPHEQKERIRSELASVNSHMLHLTAARAMQERKNGFHPTACDLGIKDGMSHFHRLTLNIPASANILDGSRYVDQADPKTQAMLGVSLRTRGGGEDETKLSTSVDDDTMGAAVASAKFEHANSGLRVHTLDKIAAVMGEKAVGAFVTDILRHGSADVDGTRVCYNGTVFPMSNLRRTFGITKTSNAGFCVEYASPESSEFVPRRHNNSTGYLFAYPVVAPELVGKEKEFGQRSLETCLKHPGYAKLPDTSPYKGQNMATSSYQQAVADNKVCLNPSGVTVTLVRCNPGPFMLRDDIAEASTLGETRRVAALTEAKDKMTHALMVYVPPDTVYGKNLNAVVRQHTATDNTLRFDRTINRFFSTRELRNGRATPVEENTPVTPEEFMNSELFQVTQRMQKSLARQMAMFASTAGLGEQSLGLKIPGGGTVELGWVTTDGWSIATAADGTKKAVYASNMIDLNQGRGMVCVFGGTGNGFTAVPSKVRTADTGGASNGNHFMIASAARLHGCEAAFLARKSKDQSELDTVRQNLADRSVFVVPSTANTGFKNGFLTRELLTYSKDPANQYQETVVVQDAIIKYGGSHASVNMAHGATLLF